MQNKLYWKISLTLLALLALLGIGYVAINSYTSTGHFMEVNQRLYKGVAQHLVDETKPLINGQPDTSATHDIMHSMMVINPAVEVYLLDTEGKIIDFVVPYKTVKRKSVNLAPIKEFIATEELKGCVLGDDPKNPGEEKVFSAAPIYENEKLTGYAYIILASEEQKAVFTSLFNSLILRTGFNTFLMTLIAALIIGLVAIAYLTKNLRKIITTVERFKDGDYKARIPENAKGDLTTLADTFNDMASQIDANIENIKSVDQLRQELIANVSHDLRTPLAIMKGYVETLLMKDDQLSKEDRIKYLKIVFNGSEKLQKLIAQLFEYSKLEANQITPVKEPFSVAELVQDIHTKYQVLAQEKEIELKIDVPRDTPLVFADIGLVERAIQNLMDNALKFTPKGGSVQLLAKVENENVEIRISDTGPGIPEEEQSYIFDRYHQATETKAKKSGAGLGLAIVKKILEIHDSTIQMQNRATQGASFWFQLPAYTS